jgi:DeoR/GlpR family transcriptional regulator of sugar metabolism
VDSKQPKAFLMLDRRARIADLVRQDGAARIDDLVERFGVSAVTIRGDLEYLDREGLIVRDRGGAIASGQASALIAFDQRTGLNLEAKRRIGKAAAQLVNAGDTMIVDAGTTAVQMIPHLPQTAALTVVTNAINVALELRLLPDAQVILLGGSLSYTTFSSSGPLADQGLEDVVVQKLFLAAQSVDLHAGVTDTSLEIARVKRAMIRAAQQVILVADSSKWGRPGFVKVTPLSAIHTVITDTNLPREAQLVIERSGTALILV